MSAGIILVPRGGSLLKDFVPALKPPWPGLCLGGGLPIRTRAGLARPVPRSGCAPRPHAGDGDGGCRGGPAPSGPTAPTGAGRRPPPAGPAQALPPLAVRRERCADTHGAAVILGCALVGLTPIRRLRRTRLIASVRRAPRRRRGAAPLRARSRRRHALGRHRHRTPHRPPSRRRSRRSRRGGGRVIEGLPRHPGPPAGGRLRNVRLGRAGFGKPHRGGEPRGVRLSVVREARGLAQVLDVGQSRAPVERQQPLRGRSETAPRRLLHSRAA